MDEMTEQVIREKLDTKELQAVAETLGLDTTGKHQELIDRIIKARVARSKQYVGKLTICQLCGKPVIVQRTMSTQMSDGRTLKTRYVKCQGKGRHTYPIKNIEDNRGKQAIGPETVKTGVPAENKQK
jgi:RNase P subunit RPR2